MIRGVKRFLVLLLALALSALSGCSQLLGTSDWDRISVTYSAGSAPGQTGNYTLVVTPTDVSYELDGKRTTEKLPDGAWDTLVTGVRALGARQGDGCPGGQFIAIQAKAGSGVKQSFQASSCDAGDAFAQAKALIEQVVRLIPR